VFGALYIKNTSFRFLAASLNFYSSDRSDSSMFGTPFISGFIATYGSPFKLSYIFIPINFLLAKGAL
jgi:hypothetical protein